MACTRENYGFIARRFDDIHNSFSEIAAVLFAELAAPPMNLLGPELVRDLFSLIQKAEADDALRVSCSKAPT